MFYAFVVAFLVAFAVIYGLMHLVCYLKKKYCQAENWLCKFFETFECVSCREACVNHLKLLIRAALFAFVVAATFTLAYCIR